MSKIKIFFSPPTEVEPALQGHAAAIQRIIVDTPEEKQQEDKAKRGLCMFDLFMAGARLDFQACTVVNLAKGTMTKSILSVREAARPARPGMLRDFLQGHHQEAREKDATSIMSTQARLRVVTTPFATALIEGNFQRVEETDPYETNSSLMASVRVVLVFCFFFGFEWFS